MAWCNSCDPKFFIIYGFCDNCGRRCEPPQFDPKRPIDYVEYNELHKKWNQERSDLILDAMRRMPNEELGYT
jgi:hypothetical protein